MEASARQASLLPGNAKNDDPAAIVNHYATIRIVALRGSTPVLTDLGLSNLRDPPGGASSEAKTAGALAQQLSLRSFADWEWNVG